ncbi:helix-turn-helix transcriptional regulator [Acinetobacter sp. YH16039]|uniref:helix-turn-helix domain-containing protein n=1 Tax=unclassified Acinetobacter TaxID=196816 RepID=UPI0015D33775|nr:helix-turn-helix transcriptional regulator [Escherichia coli]
MGTVISEEREHRGLNQASASQLCGMTQSTLARVEIGRASTIENVLKISHGFELEPWQLFKVADDRVKALKSQGYEVETELPSEKELKENSAEWVTTKTIITRASIIGLTAAGVAIVDGVIPYINKFMKKK